MGRPLLGSKPMSGAERMRRYRNRHEEKFSTPIHRRYYD
jgi:hypothetical protein